jgi:predicted ferric reductase
MPISAQRGVATKPAVQPVKSEKDVLDNIPEIDAEEPTNPPETPDDVNNLSPNRPHPALEYPLLYFGLKKWTWLFENIKDVYKIRWRLSYPLQKRLPFSRTLRKLRIHLTWGEALLLVPFWATIVSAVIYGVVYPSVSASGHVARTALIACFVFAQRNSIVTFLTGMPIDRMLFYHKLSGRVALLGTLTHAWAFLVDPHFQAHVGIENPSVATKLATAFQGSVNTSGTMIMFMVFGIIITSLPYFRRRVFEFFYFLHVMFVFGVVVGVFFHTGILGIMLVLCTWGVDVFLRSIVMARTLYPQKAKLRILSDTVVELSFPKIRGFDYNPGQYIYVALPELSFLEWHPFSLSSAPKMKTVTLHIRRAGDWTNALYELAKKKSEVSIMMEGPYGSLGVDLVGDRYKMVMLVSGGIGGESRYMQ